MLETQTIKKPIEFEPTLTHLEELNKTPLHKVKAEHKEAIVAETYSFFKDFLTQNGFTEHTDPNEVYTSLNSGFYTVRREDPRKIFPLLSKSEGYTIDFKDDRYANCVTWNPSQDGPKGIYNAYMEGFTSMNGVVSVICFEQEESDDIIAVNDSVQNFYGLDRQRVRSYRGQVTKNKVKFINLRIPGHLFPEENMTETELDAVDEYTDAIDRGVKVQPVMIHRSYTPSS